MLKPALAAMVLVVVVLGFFRLVGDHVYSCRAEATAVYFRLIGYVPLWKIAYPDIVDVRTITYREVFALRPPPFSFISRPGAQLVLIQRNRGLFKNVLATPSDPTQFVATVRRVRQP
jgi:hypothetical protein